MKCGGPLTVLGSLRSVLDEGTLDRLQERCTRELLRSIPGLERSDSISGNFQIGSIAQRVFLLRCKFEECGFAQETTQTTEQNPYFFCPLCQVTFCRQALFVFLLTGQYSCAHALLRDTLRMCKRNIDVHLDNTCEELAEAERREAERQRKVAAEDAKRIDINKL